MVDDVRILRIVVIWIRCARACHGKTGLVGFVTIFASSIASKEIKIRRLVCPEAMRYVSLDPPRHYLHSNGPRSRHAFSSDHHVQAQEFYMAQLIQFIMTDDRKFMYSWPFFDVCLRRNESAIPGSG